MLKEYEFKDSVLEKLSQYFVIKHEWEGICFGKNVRIDIVLRPKDTTLWSNKKIIMGVEFKRDFFDSAINKQLDGIKQCIDYSYADWKDIGSIPIFFCPGFGISNENGYNSICKLLSRFNVGELKETHRGLAFVMGEHHFIWDENSGVCEGKRWSMKRKTGCY